MKYENFIHGWKFEQPNPRNRENDGQYSWSQLKPLARFWTKAVLESHIGIKVNRIPINQIRDADFQGLQNKHKQCLHISGLEN